MCLLIITKVLTIEGWHLVITAIGVIVPIILMLIGFERSRRKDLRKHLGRKADLKYVDTKSDELREEIKTTMDAHEKVHQADRNMLKQMQDDLRIIKEHLIKKK